MFQKMNWAKKFIAHLKCADFNYHKEIKERK